MGKTKQKHSEETGRKVKLAKGLDRGNARKRHTHWPRTAHQLGPKSKVTQTRPGRKAQQGVAPHSPTRNTEHTEHTDHKEQSNKQSHGRTPSRSQADTRNAGAAPRPAKDNSLPQNRKRHRQAETPKEKDASHAKAKENQTTQKSPHIKHHKDEQTLEKAWKREKAEHQKKAPKRRDALRQLQQKSEE
ncbi:hypothetical protein, conserved in T. vivax [Trypanosoma vivax Y486]|uniref:Uncharacterized protein n=1 Tax=Trypanosoma vivax (strain Y486) TaxID=1055687 RepID=F9WU10_TRYVY|nr:hypothetical protein, conserved in T. vivax [Trypanosoma vivax Y486]|eukprot:CCD21056.1 hypothetical protein, conserved in T. vivax [Trypanosoma vivax Y486]